MRMFIIALSVVLFSFQQAGAQVSKEDKKTARITKRDAKVQRRDSLSKVPVGSYLSISASKVITPFPRINVGYITPLSEKWSIGGSAGIGFQGLPFTTDTSEDYSLWEVRPEIIYYIGKGKKFTNYIGLELFYVNSKETILFDNFNPVNDLSGTVELITFDRADYERTKSGFIFNFGEHTRLSDKLMVRTNFGLGVRFKDNVYSNLENAAFTTFDENENIIFPDTNPRRDEGSKVGFEFNFDLRLIYKFN